MKTLDGESCPFVILEVPEDMRLQNRPRFLFANKSKHDASITFAGDKILDGMHIKDQRSKNSDFIRRQPFGASRRFPPKPPFIKNKFPSHDGPPPPSGKFKIQPHAKYPLKPPLKPPLRYYQQIKSKYLKPFYNKPRGGGGMYRKPFGPFKPQNATFRSKPFVKREFVEKPDSKAYHKPFFADDYKDAKALYSDEKVSKEYMDFEPPPSKKTKYVSPSHSNSSHHTKEALSPTSSPSPKYLSRMKLKRKPLPRKYSSGDTSDSSREKARSRSPHSRSSSRSRNKDFKLPPRSYMKDRSPRESPEHHLEKKYAPSKQTNVYDKDYAFLPGENNSEKKYKKEYFSRDYEPNSKEYIAAHSNKAFRDFSSQGSPKPFSKHSKPHTLELPNETEHEHRRYKKEYLSSEKPSYRALSKDYSPPPFRKISTHHYEKERDLGLPPKSSTHHYEKEYSPDSIHKPSTSKYEDFSPKSLDRYSDKEYISPPRRPYDKEDSLEPHMKSPPQRYLRRDFTPPPHHKSYHLYEKEQAPYKKTRPYSDFDREFSPRHEPKHSNPFPKPRGFSKPPPEDKYFSERFDEFSPKYRHFTKHSPGKFEGGPYRQRRPYFFSSPRPRHLKWKPYVNPHKTRQVIFLDAQAYPMFFYDLGDTLLPKGTFVCLFHGIIKHVDVIPRGCPAIEALKRHEFFFAHPDCNTVNGLALDTLPQVVLLLNHKLPNSIAFYILSKMTFHDLIAKVKKTRECHFIPMDHNVIDKLFDYIG